MEFRFDLIFSYWIFIWYLLYVIKFIKYNPKFIIGFGIIENIFILLMMFYFGSTIKTIQHFIIINIFIKIIPFYTLKDTIIYKKDIFASIILFLIYCIWIYINNKSIMEYQNKIVDSLINNKNNTPLMFILNKLN